MEPVSRVLVVDDEDSNVDMLSRRLSRCGYSVVTASNGSEALQRLEQHSIDLVLLDQMMPGMTGLEVLRQIRGSRLPQQLPVIMVTAVSDSSAIAAALDQGANDYVTKPLDFQIALARIRMQLARGREDGKVRKSEERHAIAARGSGEGLWDWDLLRDTIFCTPELHHLLGLTPREKPYRLKTCLMRVHPSERIKLEGVFSRSAKHQMNDHASGGNKDCLGHTGETIPPIGDESTCQFRLRHANGRYRWFSLRGVTLRNSQGIESRRVGSIMDVTASLTIDTLTGLPNKHAFEEEIQEAMGRSSRNRSNEFSVLLFDIGHFKLLRPSLSHQAMQSLLIRFAERIQNVLSDFTKPGGGTVAHALLARMGEDEFGILLESYADSSTASALANALTAAMRPPFTVEGREIFCAINLGLVAGPSGHTVADDLLRDANTAMFTAELRGSGQWVRFEESMRTLRDQRLQTDNDLRLAVKREEFEVYYQSRVHLATGAICGFEALVRWNHPTRGMVSPLEFIPIAEENGMIHEIGLWVLEKACAQTQDWRQHFDLAEDFEVSVNLSPQQCKEPHLISRVTEILHKTGLPASSLNLELTESLLMEDIDQAKAVLHALKNLGIGLKIDDFGTGYSCLKYLCQFPFDSLKIDRSFTKELDKESFEIEEIVRTIVRMASNLKMEVVAEGVENAAHVTRLQELGCKYGQGFLFSRPVNAKAAEGLLGARRVADTTRPAEVMVAARNGGEELAS